MATKHQPNILIVDDTSLVCSLLRMVLQATGYTAVSEASDGATAVRMCTDFCPDLVCLDIEMPGMDGLQTLDAIRKLHPQLPVVMITAHSSPANVKKALKRGANGFIVKPFNPRHACETISRCLGGKYAEVNEGKTIPHTVLLVDDEPNVLAGFKRGFCNEHYDVLCAHSAEEALAVLRNSTVDLVVSDQDMPGMTGTALLNEVCLKHPDIVRFILTERGSQDIALEAMTACGISDVIVKPCTSANLAPVIRHALQQRDLLMRAKQLLRSDRRQAAELERWIETYPSTMTIKRDTHRENNTQAEDILIDILSQYRRDQVAFLLGVESRHFAPATIVSLHDTSVIAAVEHATNFRTGEETLVLLHVSPQQRYIAQTWIDTIFVDRLTLRYEHLHSRG